MSTQITSWDKKVMIKRLFFKLLWKYDNLLAKLRRFTLLSAHVQLDLVISEILWKKTWIESVNRGTRRW